jgi:hypothetical protein
MTLGLLLLTADVAHAEMGTAVLGAGQYSCGKLIATAGTTPPGARFQRTDREKGLIINEYAMYQEWLMGFVTGYNFAHNDLVEQQVARIDIAGLDLWMRNWCNQHPTQTVFQGASVFIKEMLTNAAADQAAPGSGDGYSKPARDSLKKLIEKPAAR